MIQEVEKNKLLVWVIQKADNAIKRLNHYLADSVACFVNNYPLASDFSSGWHYSAFVQLAPEQSELTVVTQNIQRT